MRKRGRPKGAGLTVIGLPKKRGNSTSTRPKAFVLQSEWEKTRGMCEIIMYPISSSNISLIIIVMLSWFLYKQVCERVVRGGDLAEEDEVECRPEKIPRKCLEDDVCLGHIRKYFKKRSKSWKHREVGYALCVTQIYMLWKVFVVIAAWTGHI